MLHHTRDSYSSAELELVPTAEDDGRVLRCEADSVAIQRPMAAEMELTVQYPPEAVTVSVSI